MTTFDRRRFLAGAGGLLAGSLAGCGFHGGGRGMLRRVRGGSPRGTVTQVPTVCLQCPAACGLLVRRVDGVPVQIKGNPAYPTNAGGLCPKGVAGLQVLYDPDRIKQPLLLPKGAKRGTLHETGRPISWEAAIDLVVKRLKKIRKDPGPHAVAFVGGRYQGSMEPLVRQWLRSYGSPNDLGNGSVGSDGTKVALEMMQGVHDYPGFDWENTNYVMSFGASWLEAFRPTAYLLRAFGHLRRGRPGRRAKFVHVDPRFSVTSAKADEWVPIRPGTDAALALGMAHVIVTEGLCDSGFLEEHAHGFEDWQDAAGSHMGFRRYVTEQWSVERAAQLSGIDARRIHVLATDFATHRPAFAVGERGTSMQTNGLYTRMAVHALNALVGSINRPGGVLVQREAPLRPLPPLVLDDVARRGLRQPRLDQAGTRRYPLAREVSQALPEAITSGQPYRPEAVFLYYTNPVFSRMNGAAFRAAFEHVPFLVSFSPFMDDSTRHCDLVLPDHTYLERWQDVPILPSVGYPIVGIRRPVIEQPLYDTRHTGDVLLAVGHALGGGIEKSLPWKDYRELMAFRLAALAGEEGMQEADWGWWDAREDAHKRFLPWDRVFRTASGKFEFHAMALRKRVGALLEPGETSDAFFASKGIEARGDEAFLPHFEPPRFHGEPDAFPLHLNTYKTMPRAEGRGANQPWLQEIDGVHLYEPWTTWLEINPDTAKALGIADGDDVLVESPRGGSLRVRARHYAGARPDVVNMPFCQGHTGYGHWARRIGVNPNDILVPDEDRLTGMAAYFGTRVRVRRA